MRPTSFLTCWKIRANHWVRHIVLDLSARFLGWSPRSVSPSQLFETPVYKGRDNAEGLEKIHKRFLVPSGWVQSRISKKSIDLEGNFLPWITYPSISFLEKLPLQELKILEFGSGASTLWFAKRSPHTVSVETNAIWHSEVSKLVGKTATVLSLAELAPTSNRASKADEIPVSILTRDASLHSTNLLRDVRDASARLRDLISNADLIFLDGGPRNSFLWMMIQFSKPSAIWIVDNSDSDELRETLREVKRDRYLRLGFWGLAPINAFPSETSVIMSYDGLTSDVLKETLSDLWSDSRSPQFFQGS